MATLQLVTLLTDVGTTDAYVGIVKGILLSRAPQARLVDLVHTAESGSLYAAAYLLAAAPPPLRWSAAWDWMNWGLPCLSGPALPAPEPDLGQTVLSWAK
jgi:hypothetical protein